MTVPGKQKGSGHAVEQGGFIVGLLQRGGLVVRIRRGVLVARKRGGLVSLLPGVVPETPVETILAGRLAAREPEPFGALVDWLAGCLWAEHRDPSCWVLDIGLWGPWLFRWAAAGAIQELEGRLLKIQDRGGIGG